jgi:hypothetical protein
MSQPAKQSSEEAPTLVWGLRNIGRIINRSEEQAAHLVKTGALGDAVKKVGGLWVGHVRQLQNLTKP